MSQAEIFRPLNAELYRRLTERFGKVIVANAGEHYSGLTVPDPLRKGRVKRIASTWGEYYRICCPTCGDSRYRLWINHLYGQEDASTGNLSMHLAHCYNEPLKCLSSPEARKAFHARVFGFQNVRDRRVATIAPATELVEVLTQVEPPGEITPLHDLPPGHPAVQYLLSRGFTPQDLRPYQIGFCHSVTNPGWTPLVGRIYIPIFMDGQLMGWQGRYVGDPPGLRNKYFGKPGMPKRLLLYNADAASQWPFAVVVEGAPSVWRIGGPATAAFGKSIKGPQQTLLRRLWPSKPIFLLLDPDAKDDMEGVLREMTATGNQPIIPVELPPKYDPADYAHDTVVRMIQAAARGYGFQLPDW